MQVTRVGFGQGCGISGDVTDTAHGVVMIDRLQVILEILAADRNAFLDHEVGFDPGERISLDRIRRVSQLEIMGVFEVGEGMRR